MKLSQIITTSLGEALNQPLDKSLPAAQQDELSRKVAGDDGEANTQIKQQLVADKEAEAEANPAQNKDLKGTLSQLGTTQWNPNDSRFQKLAAKVLGAMK